jgi:signal transduction histidine kinase
MSQSSTFAHTPSIAALAPRRPDIRLAALRVPLTLKLIGAQAGVVVALLVLETKAGFALGLTAGLVVLLLVIAHGALVMVALRPIRDLEATAQRVWMGDYGARVDASSIADDDVVRIGSMFNQLLDGLARDRTRMRALARDVIATGERDRASLARELQDSTAQHIAALLFQVSAAARDARDPDIMARLAATRDAAENVLQQVQLLSATVHPAVLNDLGLGAALRKLARESASATGIELDVHLDEGDRLLPEVEAALYRVAEEAVRNSLRHGAPEHVRVRLIQTPAMVRLEIQDDGCGFEPASVDCYQSGCRGLTSMRERMSLVDGRLEISTAPASGTTVTATVSRTTSTPLNVTSSS